LRIDFNPDEVMEVHDLLNLVCGRAPGANKHLETAIKKLRRAGASRVCVHCGTRMSRRKDRICDACNSYRSYKGVLPPYEVLTGRPTRKVS
jgi:L-asparaginase II